MAIGIAFDRTVVTLPAWRLLGPGSSRRALQFACRLLIWRARSGLLILGHTCSIFSSQVMHGTRAMPTEGGPFQNNKQVPLRFCGYNGSNCGVSGESGVAEIFGPLSERDLTWL